MTALVVVDPFDGYARGRSITDAATVAAILAGPNRPFVVIVEDGEISPEPGTLPSSEVPLASGRLPVVLAAMDLRAGTPVTFSAAARRLVPARADTKFLAFVMGVMAADCSVGFAATPATGVVTLPDWTAATGAPALITGRPYYLDAAGGLTATPDPGALCCIAAVGVALSATALMVEPATPIQL